MRNGRHFNCAVEITFPDGQVESFPSPARASIYLCRSAWWLSKKIMLYRRRTLDTWPEEIRADGYVLKLTWDVAPPAHEPRIIGGASLVSAFKSRTGRL